MPGPWFGLATRARRPRPSEKIALRVISGLSPQGHRPLVCPSTVRLPLHDHVMLRLVSGPFCGRTECAPPRKPPFTLSLGLPGKPFYGRLVIWRRGGLCTPEKASLGMIHTSQKGEQAPLSFNLRESAPRPYLGTHRLLRIRGLVFDTKGRLE
jgi:hypothetical protein